MFTTHRYCLAQSILPQLNIHMRELLWQSARFFHSWHIRILLTCMDSFFIGGSHYGLR